MITGGWMVVFAEKTNSGQKKSPTKGRRRAYSSSVGVSYETPNILPMVGLRSVIKARRIPSSA
jgi:hypothetical protein